MNENFKKLKFPALIFAICFFMYNVILFVAAGFSNHRMAFWVSWVFMLVAFVTLAFMGVMLGKKGFSIRDWWFGYPLVKHSIWFIAAEFAASVLFMILDIFVNVNVALVFIPQFILLGVYMVLAISCLYAKTTVDEVREKTLSKTMSMKLLIVDAEMLPKICKDEEARLEFVKLAEELRYSDPVSHQALVALEGELANVIANANAMLKQDKVEEALKLCKEASLLLDQRNKKCMVLKRY